MGSYQPVTSYIIKNKRSFHHLSLAYKWASHWTSVWWLLMPASLPSTQFWSKGGLPSFWTSRASCSKPQNRLWGMLREILRCGIACQNLWCFGLSILFLYMQLCYNIYVSIIFLLYVRKTMIYIYLYVADIYIYMICIQSKSLDFHPARF